MHLNFTRSILTLFLAATPVFADDLAPIFMLKHAEGRLDARTGRLAFEGPEPSDINLPIVAPKSNLPAAPYLNSLGARGKAAGLSGVVYDNRDRNHVSLPRDQFPGLSHSRYDKNLRQRSDDYGFANRALIDAITFGNASVAMTAGAQWRSMSRAAMTSRTGAAHAWLNFVSNHLYIYPEHADHDAQDYYPANWPYGLISQGSSYSVLPFLDAVAIILASFTPETRQALQTNGLVAPTVQMIFRLGQKTVRNRETYLSGIAHPVVFNSNNIQQQRMSALAQSITPATIPPRVDLQLESETFQDQAGLAELSEYLFTTSSAIGRIWRSWLWQQEMVINTTPTQDPNGHPLSFSWVVLRGDPEWVKITPLSANGDRASIQVNWPAWKGDVVSGHRPGARVDIGVFANNGHFDSAPAMISVAFPPHQNRVYEAMSSGDKRLKSVDYRASHYVDPVLFWVAPWHDKLLYSETGQFDGLTRTFPSSPERPPLEISPDGQPKKGPKMRYEPQQTKGGLVRLIMRRD